MAPLMAGASPMLRPIAAGRTDRAAWQPAARGRHVGGGLTAVTMVVVAFACGVAVPLNLILYSAGGQDIRLLDVLGAAAAPFAVGICLRRQNLLLAMVVLALAIFLPFLAHALILLERYGEVRDFVFPLRFALAMAFCIVLTPLLASHRHRVWFAIGMVLGCSLNIVPLVFERAGEHLAMVAIGLAPSDLALHPWDLELRPPGLHGHANATSAVVSLAVPVAVFMAVRHRHHWLLVAAVAATLACIYYTETRSAVAISLVTIGLALAATCRFDRLLILLVPVLALAGLAVAASSNGPLLPESFTRVDAAGENLSERLDTMLAGLRTMFENPLGLGRTLGGAAIYDLTGVRGAAAMGARGIAMSVPLHNSFVWLGVAAGLIPAVLTVVVLLGAACQVGSAGAPGLRGLLALHVFGLCFFEDHIQNQTFMVLLVLVLGGWLADRLRNLNYTGFATGSSRSVPSSDG